MFNKNYPRFKDIKQYPTCDYSVDIPLDFVIDTLDRYKKYEPILDLEPDFQRVHVWKQKQRVEYIEHILKGGIESKRPIYFNNLCFHVNDKNIKKTKICFS